MFGDIAYEAAVLGIGFGTDGRVGVGNNGEWDVFVDILAEGEVVKAWLNVTNTWGHDVDCEKVFSGEGCCVT